MIHAGRSRALVLMMIGCLLVGIVSGCAKSDVSKSSYDKITKGMTLEEVEVVLGKGKASETGEGLVDVKANGTSASVWVWEDGDKTITVVFENNKVTRKSSVGLME